MLLGNEGPGVLDAAICGAPSAFFNEAVNQREANLKHFFLLVSDPPLKP